MQLTASQKQINWADILWSLPQPVYAIGCSLLVASACLTQWADPWLLVTLISWLSLPIILLGERLSPRKEAWWLNWPELAQDTFWVLATFLFWVPFFSQHYSSHIKEVFGVLRESVGFSFSLQSTGLASMLIMALIATLLIEFVSYWLHRLQHRVLFFWRIHATHHHISKMSVGRTHRTHPLEFLGLNLGSAMTLSFFAVSIDVVAVIVAFKMATVSMNHANMPLKSGVFGWVFNTAEYHQLHHSLDFDESNRNYGCVVILWDRVFGTFSAQPDIEKVGAGTGEKLPLWKQMALPFFSNKALKEL